MKEQNDGSKAPSKTIAIDFDDCLFRTTWPDIVAPIWSVICAAKEEQAAGADLILWTTREGKYLEDALAACESVGLRFVAVNENSPYMKALWGNDPRKIGADEYWDDKAVPVEFVGTYADEWETFADE